MDWFGWLSFVGPTRILRWFCRRPDRHNGFVWVRMTYCPFAIDGDPSVEY